MNECPVPARFLLGFEHLGLKKMGTDTIGNQSWTLTVVRDYKSANDNDIAEAKFAYGRTASELEDEDRCSALLPTGLMHLLTRAELTREALESGFIAEMSARPQRGEEWVCFERAAVCTHEIPGLHFGPTVAFYALEDGEEFFEMVELGMAREDTTLPLRVWLRVSEMDGGTLAWVIDSELLKGDEMHQTSLDVWFDLEEFTSMKGKEPWKRKSLSLPGPPSQPYEFR